MSTLQRYARRVNPLLADLLDPLPYYWVSAEVEYATDLVFKSPRALRDFAPRLLEYRTCSFTPQDVMTFLGRKRHGKFEGEVITDLPAHELKGRQPGRRVKHRMKQNWIKMYDKAGLVLRVETVINQPEEFRVRRRVRRRGRRKTEWVPLRKSVAYLFRYREICRQCNSRPLLPWPWSRTRPLPCAVSTTSPWVRPRPLADPSKPSTPSPARTTTSSAPS